MRHLISATILVVALPGAASAQIDILLEGATPVLRANVAGVALSARLGSRGIELGVDDPVNTRGTTIWTSSRSRSTTTRTSTTTRRTSTRASASAGAILASADNYLGTPYVWGGSTPVGFDCSGFTQYVFRQHGVYLPRVSRQQAQVGQAVSTSLYALQPGDLLFFASNGSRIDHVAIYAGNNEIIHSSKSGGGVGYDNLTSKRGRWFATHHVATRRVLADGTSLVGPLTAALRAFVTYDPPDRAPRR